MQIQRGHIDINHYVWRMALLQLFLSLF